MGGWCELGCSCEVGIDQVIESSGNHGSSTSHCESHLDPALLTYIVEIVTRTREDPRVVVGASPRGSLALFKLGRARAVLFGRDFITPDDIKAVAINALHHRIILKPEPRIRGVLPQDILNKIMAEVPVPAL